MTADSPDAVGLAVYVLAGGRSRRFGSDKARATLDGRPLISRLADQLQPVAESITVVADAAGKYEDLGLTTIADIHRGLGPMAGLVTAMGDLSERGGGEWLLLVACDLVEARPRWVSQLRAAARRPRVAAAFRDAQGRWEPLLALYHVSLAKQVAERLEGGRLAMRGLLDDIRAAAVPLPADWPAVSQINTPGEHRRVAGGGGGADEM